MTLLNMIVLSIFKHLSKFIAPTVLKIQLNVANNVAKSLLDEEAWSFSHTVFN